MKKQTLFVVQAAVLAAIYTALTITPGISMISFNWLQVRIAEAMCIFVFFTPAAIPGLFVG